MPDTEGGLTFTVLRFLLPVPVPWVELTLVSGSLKLNAVEFAWMTLLIMNILGFFSPHPTPLFFSPFLLLSLGLRTHWTKVLRLHLWQKFTERMPVGEQVL